MDRRLLLTLAALSCTPEPHLPPPDLEGCQLLCERYQALGCDGATEAGAPCSDWCPNSFSPGELNTRCVREALSCPAIDACE